MPKYIRARNSGLTPDNHPRFLRTVARRFPQTLMLKNQCPSELDQQVHTRKEENIKWKCESKGEIYVEHWNKRIENHITPCFPKYRVRVRDNGQQIFMKREISSVNTLFCSKGVKFSHTYTKDNQIFLFHI